MSAIEQQKSDESRPKARPIPAVTRIGVAGFKSFGEYTSAEIRPLTILAGANSSGKSSLLQPLLLLKQTLDVTYDPGALKLDGPNVTFTSVEQFLSRVVGNAEEFRATIEFSVVKLEIAFVQPPKGELAVHEVCFHSDEGGVSILPTSTIPDLRQQLEKLVVEPPIVPHLDQLLTRLSDEDIDLVFARFLPVLQSPSGIYLTGPVFFWFWVLESVLAQTIHVPGLRGNPQRTYSHSGIGPAYPGTFEKYTASILHHWQETDRNALQSVSDDLQKLGLTWKVEVGKIDQTQLEIKVGRLLKAARGGGKDVVNIADVGFGVSQVLPVVAALRAALPGQLVYVEQPELHLHPRAAGQIALLLADAASRGVRVVTETHSQELLLGVQTLVAEGKLDPSLVKLHWFERGSDGCSTITSTDLDESGAFGDWPEDFSDASLHAQSRYLDAAESRIAERATS